MSTPPDHQPKIGGPQVYTGRNTIRVNKETMNRIVSEWLHAYHSGGPYEVNDVCEREEGYGCTVFEITFTDKPHEAA